jgi:5'-nucleotidase|nr:5'-nucleotidase C-terminal domain-containing protein [Gemmatimonadaceae bacterium]
MRFDDWLGPGPITAHELESIFLFADETRVVTFPLSGARLREVLEHGVSQRRLGSGAYPQVSGVRFSFDARLPSGRRIVGPLRRDDGREIGDAEIVQVAFPSFPSCRGGDGYQVPEAQAVCARHDADPSSAPRSAELLVQHVVGMGGTIVPPATGRVGRMDRR